MAFIEGRSGNPKGRPKMSDDEKAQREEFKRLLRTATVPALRSIVEISQSKCNKDRFAAAKFIVEKAYGSNVAFLSNGVEDDIEPVQIIITPYHKEDEAEDEEWGEEDPDEEWEE